MLLRGVALFSDVLFTYAVWLQACWEEEWSLGVPFRKGQRRQSSWSLGTKEREAGFLSGEGYLSPPPMSLWFIQASL